MPWVEPIGKMVASNKGILAVLWELYPKHPLLLEAHIDNPAMMIDYVRKRLYSREGANVALFNASESTVKTLGTSDGEDDFVSYICCKVIGAANRLSSKVIATEKRGIRCNGSLR
jgi:glutathionylspermidine synthase